MKKTLSIYFSALLFTSLTAFGAHHKMHKPGGASDKMPSDNSAMMCDCMHCPMAKKMSQDMKPQMALMTVKQAVAVIQPTAGNDVRGAVYFERVDEGVRVSGTVRGLSPGKHGFHIHEYGDLSKTDGTSAGGHYAPKGHEHGAPDDQQRHIGDLGNIEANQNGVAEFSFVDDRIQLMGPFTILGRGLIIHKNADDLTSQPTGNAGPRVAMAVIGVQNTE